MGERHGRHEGGPSSGGGWAGGGGKRMRHAGR
jgi:hypothetical protein